MTTLFAQPYDISANGFYFENIEQYDEKAARALNHYGDPAEEFEIQFIDGDGIDCDLFIALGVHQGDIGPYFEAVLSWSEHQKTNVIIAVREVGYQFNITSDDPDKFDMDLYECDCMRDLAIQFVDEGLFGEIPKTIENYLDYDAIARDLSVEYAETEVDGTRYIYRCA